VKLKIFYGRNFSSRRLGYFLVEALWDGVAYVWRRWWRWVLGVMALAALGTWIFAIWRLI
jgi:hypothetical protein